MYHCDMQNDIVTVDEFAKLIGSTRGTVIRLIKSGKILAFRLSDSMKSPYRIKRSEVERLISFELHKNYGKEK
jgi:excisionase family DNA binding protein